MQSIAKVKRQINPKLKIDGILFTMVDSRTNEAKEIIASLRAHYGEKIRVFGTEIPFPSEPQKPAAGARAFLPTTRTARSPPHTAR